MATAIEYGSRVHFKSRGPWDLSILLHRLHSSQSIANKEYLKVELVRFHHEYDNMIDSGVMQLLGSERPYPFYYPISLTTFPVKSIFDIKDPPQNLRLPGSLGIAAMMCRSLLTQSRYNPDAVPVKRWWQVIVGLLRCCANLVRIEMPSERVDVTWYGNKFPQIQMDSKRQIGVGRWRWGEDPKEVVEVLYEQSLQFE
jgi:hypothetical protein